MTDLKMLRESKAWPVVEALKVVERVEKVPPEKGFVLFQTGYGPSGLPHIGTFGEVFRTSLVRQVFDLLSDIPSRLYAFSDDMDGLRKVPDNLPNQAMVMEHLGKPLTAIPDPFGTHPSFGDHMNGRLVEFLDGFGFEYEHQSATKLYKSGAFNDEIRRLLEKFEQVKQAVLPVLGPERRETYSPVLPICPETGVVLQVPILEVDPNDGTVTYKNEAGELVTQSALDGHAKLQWRPDWAMRWAALGVDYEMSGKDLIDAHKLSARICQILGKTPPEGFFYELFLDEQGQKISKSKGNGLSVDEWLTYGPKESLKLFMYQSPKKAKRLYFDVIPRQVDDYSTFLEKFPEQDETKQIVNPVWHMHKRQPPPGDLPITFAMLLNLASVVNAEEPSVLWSFIKRYAPDATPEAMPLLTELVEHALAYYRDFVKPNKAYRLPNAEERKGLEELSTFLHGFEMDYDQPDAAAARVQEEIYEIGKRHGFADNLRGWFQALYEILLGQSQGPRFGSFVAFYGPSETRELIDHVLKGEALGKPAA